jgi:phage head maturation protease
MVVKGVNVEERTVEGFGSTIQPDMIRDIIDPAAWKKSLARWKKRGSMPKFLAYHLHRTFTADSPVLGPMQWLKVLLDEGLKFRAQFAETPLGEQHLQLYSTGAMDAFSVGFQILEATMDVDVIREYLKAHKLRFKVPQEVDRLILEAELLEISCVVLGANMTALVTHSAADDCSNCGHCDGSKCGSHHGKNFAAKALERIETVAGIILDGDGKAVYKDSQLASAEEEKAAQPKEAVIKEEKGEDVEGIEELEAPEKFKVESLAGEPLLVDEKRVIPYKDLGYVENEAAAWDGPRQRREADVAKLLKMCAWYDSENPDSKGSYKLPHHQASDLKAVWRGVAAAMGALLGARDGADIPSGDRRRVYNHIARHYAHWDKEAPEFREYSPEELKGLEEKDLITLQEPVEKKEEKTQSALDTEQLSATVERVGKLEIQVEGLARALDLLKKEMPATSGEAGGALPQTAGPVEGAEGTEEAKGANAVLDRIMSDLESAVDSVKGVTG